MFKRHIASALANHELTRSMGLRKTLSKHLNTWKEKLTPDENI
jgi:hypothetical protein